MDRHDHRLIVEAAVAVFDFDGTLARLVLDWSALKAELATLADQRGHPGRFAGPLDPDLREIRMIDSDSFDALCAHIAKREFEGFDSATIDRTMVALLHERQHAAAPSAVFTANTGAAIERAMADPAWRGIDVMVVGKADVIRGKPAGEGLELIADHFGIAPSELVFVGDSDDDAKAAEAVGARHVRVDALPIPG